MRPHQRIVFVLPFAFLVLASCGDIRYAEDTYACTPDAADTCPAGWVCAWSTASGTNRCFSSAPADAGVDPDADAGESCGPETCLGCCDPLGACLNGDQDTLCGGQGDACEDCTSELGGFCSGQTCQSSACVDNDGDGHGVDCALGPDECDDDEHNWTVGGCASCADVDGDDYRGTDCDLSDDCDDGAPGVLGPCQANGCPQGWIHIAAGAFWMGCHLGELGNTCDLDEQPRHRVTLSAYCMEETEVSVGAYRLCKSAGECTGTPTESGTGTEDWCNWSADAGTREAHPVNCIIWSESQQYCQAWLGGDLPTEAEWEKAARGAYPGQRNYPWGSIPEPDCSRSNFDVNGDSYGFGCGSVTSGPGTWEVGYLSSGAGDSPYGLKDMAGNVYEWVRDWYQSDFYTSCIGVCTNPLNTDPTSNTRVIRGGNFYSTDASSLSVVNRHNIDPARRDFYGLGFRCRRTP